MLKFQVLAPSSTCSSPYQISRFSASGSDEQQHKMVPLPNSALPLRRRLPSPSPSLPDRCGRPPPLPRGKGAEWGNLKVYTARIKAYTDYKTLRVCTRDSTAEVVRQLVEDKLRLSLRDLNLFHLFMEVRTRRQDGSEAKSLLELDSAACPLELQRCHPEGMQRFILGMDSNAILARIHNSEVCPESNYKSVFISRRTTCAEVLAMLRQMCRLGAAQSEGRESDRPRRKSELGLDAISELRLFVEGPVHGQLVPPECALAGVYLSLLPGQRLTLRRIILPPRTFEVKFLPPRYPDQ